MINNLPFDKEAMKWLVSKKGYVKSFRTLEDHIGKAILFFGNANIKKITTAHIGLFITALSVSDKTKANILATLHSFMNSVAQEHKFYLVRFPRIRYELKWRKTITRAQQLKILREVRRITPFDPKIYLGILILASRISIRPKELLEVKCEDFDIEIGTVRILKSKVHGKYKEVTLPKDIIKQIKKLIKEELLSSYFFKNLKRKGCKEGRRYNVHLFYDWWKRACCNLGIEGVDLYGGTKHSTAKNMRQKGKTPEEIQRAMMSETTKSTARYYQFNFNEERQIYDERFISWAVRDLNPLRLMGLR